MTEGSPFQEFPSYVHKSSPKPKFLLFIIGSIVLFALGGGYYFLTIAKQSSTANASPVPVTPKPTASIPPRVAASVSAIVSPAAKPSPTTKSKAPTPAPTLAKTVDRSKLRIAILNGSGTPGAAKEISADLNNLGYTIATIGNAEEFDYTNMTIKIKKSKRDYLPQLQKDLSEISEVAITTKEDDTIETDAEVIVGK